METIYTRPEKLNLLTNEQLKALHQRDIELESKAEETNDSWVPITSYTRKWYSCMINAKTDWDKIYKLTNEQFYEVIHWLSVEDEPLNDKGFGRPGYAKELARNIKYAMSDKQRDVAYKIIRQRFDFGEDYRPKRIR